MNESPAPISALKLVSNKNVFHIWADDGESIRVFGIGRGLFRSKALRGIGLSLKKFVESSAEVRAVLNFGHAIGDRDGKS